MESIMKWINILLFILFLFLFIEKDKKKKKINNNLKNIFSS